MIHLYGPLGFDLGFVLQPISDERNVFTYRHHFEIALGKAFRLSSLIEVGIEVHEPVPNDRRTISSA